MRYLIDTNILLYAANADCEEHAVAGGFLLRHLKEATPLCLTWGIVYEFLRVSTHVRVFSNPLSPEEALAFLDVVMSEETVTLLVATERHRDLLKRTVSELSHPAGNLFHDIETATLMREHGVSEIVTADNDFRQFQFLKVRNPLLPSG